MTPRRVSIMLVSILCNLTVVFTDDPVSCYNIQPGLLAGIVSADVLLTLILVFLTYRWTINQHPKKPPHKEGKTVYMNFQAKRRT
ncbi:hematopoietic cell signal transducer [Nerophis lumbriciformis]|uniref:hematopoietic cell signal transducer n=1 Tax=Nerophis lumbriciformis TaxID=546530 RepID=UPI003BA89A4C